MKRRSSKKKRQLQTAQEHLSVLFSQLQATPYTSLRLARRYISLIRRLSRKFRISLNRPIQRSFCKHCYEPLYFGKNCTVRVRKARKIYHCHACKRVFRVPFTKK